VQCEKDRDLIGPLLADLFSLLAKFLTNPLNVNLAVIGIILKLASHPQKLLLNVLFSEASNNGSFLHEILTQVSSQMETFINCFTPSAQVLDRATLPKLIQVARHYLIFREMLPADDSLKPQKRSTMLKSLFSLKNEQQMPVPTPIPCSQNLFGESAEAIYSCQTVLGIMIYSEFLKELAAISFEHGLRTIDIIPL
ncbi:hypothetical protein Ciccas_014414, partial [Cichlidogyrus casuarinus]